jgi:hypothetical protein
MVVKLETDAGMKHCLQSQPPPSENKGHTSVSLSLFFRPLRIRAVPEHFYHCFDPDGRKNGAEVMPTNRRDSYDRAAGMIPDFARRPSF